jgi:predicted neutral ceramidase superfamily lipid hydrolase
MRWATPPERRSIRLVGYPLRFLTPTSIFLVLAASFLTVVGAGITAVTYRQQSLSEQLPQEGLGMLKAGLILQLVGFATASSLAVWFMLVSRCWTSSSLPPTTHQRVGWRSLGWAVTLAMLLLTVSQN